MTQLRRTWFYLALVALGTSAPLFAQPLIVPGAKYTYTSDDCYDKPANLAYIEVTIVAGGGGGGGAAGGSGEGVGRGGGGGGSSYKRIQADDLLSSECFTVGQGGDGGTAGANDGTNGEDTVFGTHFYATGGTGGAGGANGTGTGRGTGADPGSGVNGDINITGEAGGAATRLSGLATLTNTGGGTIFGSGAKAPGLNSLPNHGLVYGSGGSGANANTTNRQGGNGAFGIVIIDEFLIADALAYEGPTAEEFDEFKNDTFEFGVYLAALFFFCAGFYTGTRQ